MKFNVNTDAVVVHTNKLERLSKSAFPNAVRGTLNSLAFDVREKTMPEVVGQTFESRRKDFFNASSRVEMARGFAVDSMESKVGFIPFKGTNEAVQDLEQQEHGGKIGGRSFIAMDKARISRSGKRSVSAGNRLKKIKKRNVVHVSKVRGRNESMRILHSVAKAGRGGFILTDGVLFKVKSFSRAKGRVRFKLDAIYSYKKNRSISVKATHFMEKATKKTMKKADKLFIKQAEREFNKALR